MKKIHLLFALAAMLAIGCSKDDGDSTFDIRVPGGSILVEYTHNIGEEYETRHTFSDRGTKFDKIYDGAGNVIKEFVYEGNKIVEIIATVTDGLDHYFYQYTGNSITSITVEETRNGVTTTLTEEYTYENNWITVNTPDDPPNLFKKRYTLNASGKILELDTYERTGSDSYEYSFYRYEYNNAGRIESFDIDGGLYRPSDQAYFGDLDRSFYGGWVYFDTVLSPFKNLKDHCYQVMLFTPEIFNDGIFASGSLGLLENNLVTQYWAVNEGYNRYVEWELLRPKNILVQTNGLPYSGNVMFGFRPFEFTYTE